MVLSLPSGRSLRGSQAAPGASGGGNAKAWLCRACGFWEGDESPDGRPRSHRHLLENPFHLLGGCTLDSRSQLAVRAAWRESQIGPGAAAALAMLLDPVERLGAEVAWLPRVRPSQAAQVVRLILTDPDSDLPVVGLSALARANALATQLVFGGGRHRPEQTLARVDALAEAAAAIDPAEVLADVNADRAEAGFAPAEDGPGLRAALDRRRQFYLGAAVGSLLGPAGP
jgi:hypothetical protein